MEEIFSPIARRSPKKVNGGNMKGLFGSSTVDETTNETAKEFFATPDKADAAYNAAAANAAASDSDDSTVVAAKA